jgi:type IV secretion system protein VirB1
MLPGMEMLACRNLAVSPQVMQHIVQVESSANPYAIGVVGGQLERQPGNLAEALATVQMLDARGYNFSVGLAQINRANLGRYGLDSYSKAFDACGNLTAGAHILADCYASARGDWGKAFSCYYSGNFTAGFRDGYVKKVYASIDREAGGSVKSSAIHPPVEAIALRPQPAASRTADTPARTTDLEPVSGYVPGSANYRVALRSMAIDAAAAATVPAIVAMASRTTRAAPAAADSALTNANDTHADRAAPTASDQPDAPATSVARTSQASVSGGDRNNAVFVPEVRGPDDATGTTTSRESATPQTMLSPAGADRADLRQEQRDAAFVF